MGTWISISIDAFKAARLLRSRHPRSAVSRAYFAVYAAVTSEILKDRAITFGRGRPNPEHGRLLNFVQQSFEKLGHPPELIAEVKRCIRDLRRDRVRADYGPRELVDERDAKEGLRRAEQSLKHLRLPI